MYDIFRVSPLGCGHDIELVARTSHLDLALKTTDELQRITDQLPIPKIHVILDYTACQHRQIYVTEYGRPGGWPYGRGS